MKKVCKLLIACLCIATLTACSGYTSAPPRKTATPTPTPAPMPQMETKFESENVMIRIEMDNGGVMEFDLYPSKAPKTVENFTNLAKQGFYNGLTFHRIMSGFMIQGGDPEGTGQGGPGTTVEGEFAANGHPENTISHVRGAISMARSNDFNSAGSQFFIVHADSTFLDGQYAAFGMITSGEDVLDALAATPVNGETPVTAPVIKSITVL